MELTKEQVMKLVNAYKEAFGLDRRYKWVAVDDDGEIAVFTSKPKISFDKAWWGCCGKFKNIASGGKLISNNADLCFKIQ